MELFCRKAVRNLQHLGARIFNEVRISGIYVVPTPNIVHNCLSKNLIYSHNLFFLPQHYLQFPKNELLWWVAPELLYSVK